MNPVVDHSAQAEGIRSAIAVGGATVSFVTLNEIVTLLTLVYILVVLFNATPKLAQTVKHWREKWKAKRTRGDE